MDSETAIDIATDIIPLANKMVVNIPGYWSSSLISKVATLVVVTSWRITSVEQIELGSGQYSYSKSDVDNVVVIMPVVTRKVSIVLNRLPDSMGSRQWQDLVDSCGQLEVLGFLGGRLDRSGGREVVEWLGKVGRAEFLWVDFEDMEYFCKAVVQGVGDDGWRCGELELSSSTEKDREEVVKLGEKMGWRVVQVEKKIVIKK